MFSLTNTEPELLMDFYICEENELSIMVFGFFTVLAPGLAISTKSRLGAWNVGGYPPGELSNVDMFFDCCIAIVCIIINNELNCRLLDQMFNLL